MSGSVGEREGWHTVHVRVNDAATGQPTPCRVRLTSPEGSYYPPYGRLAEFATGRNQDVGGHLLLGMKPFAYTDGSFEVRLPAGPLIAELSKGPEYTPLRHDINLTAGKLALRFGLERWSDLRQEGWYSGDMRCHFLTPNAALLEAAAEDIAVVNLLACECSVPGSNQKNYPSLSNILTFSGQQPALECPGHMVVVNTLNTHPILGNLGLLSCHRVVYPLSFGGSDRFDDWTFADWCDQCHRKGGLVVWSKTWHESAAFRLGEPLADLILGKVDAYEIDFFEDSPFDMLADWYKLLNSGIAVPLVGASGKDSNTVALGSMRTYARLQGQEAFTYKAWIEAVRTGRTFVTNGPLLCFTANGHDPGATVSLEAAGQSVRVLAEARSIVPFEQLEILLNGVAVAKAEATGTPSRSSLEAHIAIPASGWIAARCKGSRQLFHRPANQRIFAHSSPIYLRVAGLSPRPDPAVVSMLSKELDNMLEWAEREARCENDRQREHLAEVIRQAKAVLSARPRN